MQYAQESTPSRTSLRGVYLPLVTPFLDDQVDHASIERLLARYRHSGIAGLVLLGTTGESPVLTASETEQIVGLVVSVLDGRLRDELRRRLPADAVVRPADAHLHHRTDTVASDLRPQPSPEIRSRS